MSMIGMYPQGPANIITTWPIANPAAGADWAVTVPAGRLWKIRAWSARLFASAAAGNRQVNFYVNLPTAGTGRLITLQHPDIQTASLQFIYQFAIYGIQQASTGMVTNTTHYFEGCDFLLSGGSVFGVATVGILAGDQWHLTDIDSVNIEEYLMS